ncbi:MAG: hypothetical protein CR986_06135 [Ignavibacteriae bacterium]|nr:MAG: hypothetical protein CR986_06135 [Ignavibacteriota bacterium]
MLKKHLTIGLSIFLILLFSVACDQTKDTVEKAKDAVNKTAESVNKTAEEAVDKVGETTEKVVEETKDVTKKVAEEVKNLFDSNKLVGAWKGKLAGRETILTITSAKNNKVNGKTVVNLGKLIRQDVKGIFNAETRTLNLQDQLNLKDKGKYEGTISKDGKSYSGTFTVLKSNEKVKFKLFKK